MRILRLPESLPSGSENCWLGALPVGSVAVSSSPPQPARRTAVAVAPWMNRRRLIVCGPNGSNSLVIALSPGCPVGPLPGPRLAKQRVVRRRTGETDGRFRPPNGRLGGRRVPGHLGHPPGEGAHDLALDLGVLLEQVMEVLAREDEDTQRCLGSDGGGAWNLFDKGDLADEVAGAAGADSAALALDLGIALDDHEELVTDLALPGEGGALGDLHVLTYASQLGELLLRQPLEQRGALECLDLGVLTEEPHRRLTYPGAVAESSGVEIPVARDALEVVVAAVLEVDAGAGGEVADDARYEYFAGLRLGGDAGADVDGDALDPVVDDLHLARVDAGADLEAELVDGVDRLVGAGDRPRGTGEGGEEAVTGASYLPAVVAGELGPDHRVVRLEELAPALVAELGGS